MHVLILSPYPDRLTKAIEEAGDTWGALSDPITVRNQADFIVSYGYRYILGKDVLEKYAGKAINLHISLLPWNRGADPNFWAWFDHTPMGVTIHQMDAGLDTGPILAQEEIYFEDQEDQTLATSYRILQDSIERLFEREWKAIRVGGSSVPQLRKSGSYHRASDKLPYWEMMPKGYDTPVLEVRGLAKQRNLSERTNQ